MLKKNAEWVLLAKHCEHSMLEFPEVAPLQVGSLPPGHSKSGHQLIQNN